MARCVICDEALDEVRIDKRTGKITPCSACFSEVRDTVEDYDYRDAAVGFTGRVEKPKAFTYGKQAKKESNYE